MKRNPFKKAKEKKIIGSKVRFYIDFIILACCLVITFNFHPINIQNTSDTTDTNEKTKMLYIFHDYEGNEFVLNDTIHGSANSWDYLFEDDVPDPLKGESENSVSLSGKNQEENNDKVKDNQVSIDDIIVDLGINDPKYNEEDNTVVINLSSGVQENTEIEYTIKEEKVDDAPVLIIEKIDNESNSDNSLLSAQTFSFTTDGRLLPTLIPRDEIQFNNSISPSISYIDGSGHIISGSGTNYNKSDKDEGNVTILDDYKDCTTPWGYKIVHGDSVLAYKQLDNAPDICNIERRYCWNGKLSGTYTQQGCSINKGYTYEQWGEAEVVKKVEEPKKGTTQNDDGTVNVKSPETTGSFVFDRPSQAHTEYYYSDNIRPKDPEIEQSQRPHWDCTAPWGEKIEHGTFVQAFKHSNGFSDAPCQAQLRLCTNGNLMGTYTESTCKTRDTSFIDWINGSPTRETYSKEKLERVKKLIKAEKNYNKEYSRFTNSEELDKILNILDS